MLCHILTGGNLKPMITPGSWSRQVSPGNVFAAIRITTVIIVTSQIRSQILS